jgi:tape measure domain-containing protein
MADSKKRVEIDVRTTGAQKAEADLKRLGESGDRGLRAIVGGAEAADAALRLLGPVIGRVTVAATAGLAIRQLVRAGDELSASLARLGSATGNVTTAAEVYDRLYAASLRTGVSVSDSISAFTRFSVAARDIGATNDQVLRLIAGIQGFGRLAGTSSAEMSAATLQLGQALASGTLQGDELRSILEAMPQLAQALAGELGLSVGELRKAGSEGRLTADQVFPALLRAAEGVQRQLAGLPVTLEQGTGILTTAMDRFLGQLDQAIGGSRRLAQGLATAGQALDSTRQALLGPGSQDERFSANAGRIRDLQARRQALNDPAQNPQPLLGQAEAERERLARIRALDDEIARLGIEQDDIERDRTARRLTEQAEAERRAREQRRTAAQAAYNELREQTDREFKLRKEFSERSVLLERARAGGAISEDQFIADSARLQRQLQEDLDKLREGAGRAAAATGSELAKALERLREQQSREQASEAQKIFEQTRTPAERYSETIRRLGDLLRVGAIDQDTFNRATDQANRTLDEAGATASEVTGAIEALGERLDGAGNEAARTLARMAVGVDGVRFSVKNFVQDLASGVLERLIRDQITAPISNALLQLARLGIQQVGFAFGGGPTPSPGKVPIDGGLKSARGNAFDAGRLIPFARGGVLASPIAFPLAGGAAGIAGEAGPEAIMPLARDTRGRLGVRGGDRGGTVVVNVIDQRGANAGAVETRETSSQDGSRQIDVLITDRVDAALAAGRFDRTLAGSFGIRRRGFA